MNDSLPLPDVEDPLFEPFFSAAARGELAIPRCTSCGKAAWPPRPICPECTGGDLEWSATDPAGTLFSWVEIHHTAAGGLPTPYVVGLITLNEAPSVRMLGRVLECESSDLSIGAPMTTRFSPVSDRVTLVHWTADESIETAVRPLQNRPKRQKEE